MIQAADIKDKSASTIAIIGAGAFGTALATVLAQSSKSKVTLLGRNTSLMADLRAGLPAHPGLGGITMPPNLHLTCDPTSLETAEIVLFAMPSQAQGEAALYYKPFLRKDCQIVLCAKGLERKTTRFLTSVLEEALPEADISVLSGPGFAADIARGLPTAMVLAAKSLENAEKLAASLSTPSFRLYASDDRLGVQMGGALKNVLAIACGIVEGRGLGQSARAALIARGLAEMSRLTLALGGKAETVSGLSGLGDLVLTATSHQSRNMRYGLTLASGRSDARDLVEGAFTAAVAARMAENNHIDMPITQAVADIIDGTLTIDHAVERLMRRPITTE